MILTKYQLEGRSKMAEYLSYKISEVIDSIEKGKMILPAIQRDFVWEEAKVCNLFDSIIKDYPIGTFLLWEVSADQVKDYGFNHFVKEYNEQVSGLHRGSQVESEINREYIGVLDGQQRITSLYIGICGKYRTKIKGKKKGIASSYVDRFLCLDVLFDPSEEENYNFRFKPIEEIEKRKENEETGKDEYWVRVSDVFKSSFDASDYVDEHESEAFINSPERTTARKMLTKLQDALTKNQVVNYYVSKSKDLLEVVEIFVRINNAGVDLKASDLMLSVASGSHMEDIHVTLNEAIDMIKDASSPNTSLAVDNELLLTAGLYFTGAESLSLKKRENYSKERLDIIFDNWEKSINSIKNAVGFIERIGFTPNKLTSKNLILPIAYYFYKNNLSDSHKSSNSAKAKTDRVFIRQWLLRAQINSIFRDGIGSTLRQIRDVIDASTSNCFPLRDLMSSQMTRSLDIRNDTIEDMMDYKYGDGRIYPLLQEIIGTFPGQKYHLDHIWSKDILLSKKNTKKHMPTITNIEYESFKSNCHRLANLQLLTDTANEEKGVTTFKTWVEQSHPNRATDSYYIENCIPTDIEYDFSNFMVFVSKREELLKTRIADALPSNYDDIVSKYHL